MSSNSFALAGSQSQSGVAGFLAGVVARVRRARELSRARAELYRMDDHELADLGIARGEIARVVETGRTLRR
jgi:uncharacterized protein YjiS (DUF1127 family)